MFPSGSVQVLKVCKQPPLPQTTPPQTLQLSFFDLFWHFTPPNQRVLFYKTNTHISTIVQNLRESLSSALHHFYPLAGTLVGSPESDKLEIRCGGEGDGVAFVEAETDADFQRLVDDDFHDVTVYRKLVPPLDISELPAPLLAVQVTRFVSGGICIGISGHHMVMDGSGFWQFVKSWAEICKCGGLQLHPSHDRSIIRDMDGASKAFLGESQSTLPKVKIFYRDPAKIVKRTFQVSAASIHMLKERATKHQIGPSSDPVSTFVAISAYTWVCSARARRIQKDENTALIFLADCRSRLDPPVVQGYFGNCVKPCIVQAKGRELQGEPGFGFTITEIPRVAWEKLDEPLKDSKSWIRESLPLVSGTIMTVASSPRFRVYDTDFGWGRPNRVELASMNGEGSMVVAERRDEEGGLQVSVALAPSHMEEFAKLFYDGFHGGMALKESGNE